MSNEKKSIREKVDCSGKTPEELIASAKEHGIELSDSQMDQISGGSWASGYVARCTVCNKYFSIEEDTEHVQCPHCHSMILVS